MITKLDQQTSRVLYSASFRYLYIILISIHAFSTPAWALRDAGATVPTEPRLYTVTRQEESKLSSDRFFGVKVEGVQQLCLFRPIKLAAVGSDGPSTISIYAIGHDQNTDRVSVPQFVLKNRTAFWITLLVIAMIAGCFSQRLLRKLELNVKNRMAGFTLTALAAFLILLIGKGCLGIPGSILMNLRGELVEGGTLCVDNATANRVQIYLDGRLHAVVPGGHHWVIPPAKTKTGRQLHLSDSQGDGDVVGLPLPEDYVFVYNVSRANSYFVKRLDYERR